LQVATVIAAGAVLGGCRGNDSIESPSTATPPATPTPLDVIAVPDYDDPTVWAGRTLVVTSWGGEYEDAQARAIFEPFQRLTGAEIETASTDIDNLRRMVEDNDVEWDVCDVLSEDVLPLANLGVLEQLDFNAIDTSRLFDDHRSAYSIASSYYSTLLAYRTDAFAGSGPQSWADFWDTTAFPGNRALHRNPQGTLEFALLADGVAMNDLYPLDVDRAFASLDRIVAAVTLWWEQGAQPAQTVTSGDLVMVSAWHSRILKIQQEGAAVDMAWNGGALSGDSWVVPLGAPNRDVAMDLINFASRAEVCAAFASSVPFGPVNRDAFALLPPEAQAYLPTSPLLKEQQFTVDLAWWFRHREATQEQFEVWLAERL
jgi:putative spermidine/putrescine transport system substrate-binding protein